MNFTIQIKYGPYEHQGIIRHKPQRLRSITEALNRLRCLIELVPTRHLNRVTFHVWDRLVFSCDIRTLSFNGSYSDPVAQNILKAIRRHVRLFDKEENMPKFQHISKGMRMMQLNSLPGKDELDNSNVSVIFLKMGSGKSPNKKNFSFQPKRHSISDTYSSDDVLGAEDIDSTTQNSYNFQWCPLTFDESEDLLLETMCLCENSDTGTPSATMGLATTLSECKGPCGDPLCMSIGSESSHIINSQDMLPKDSVTDELSEYSETSSFDRKRNSNLPELIQIHATGNQSEIFSEMLVIPASKLNTNHSSTANRTSK